MAAPLNVQLRNAESAILFMQQEHAKTLQGLHQELQKLQKKCSELTFELAMKSGSPDEEFYEKQQKLLESQLREKIKECSEVEAQLQKRDAKIGILEQQAKMQERRHQDDIKQYQHKLTSMTGELEQRSNSLAYMTTQLHQLKLRHMARDHEEATPPAERIGSPVPPKDKPQHVRRHRLRSSSIGLIPGEHLKGHIRAVHPCGIDSSDLLGYTTDAATKQFIVTARHSSSARPHLPLTRSRTEIMNLHPFLTKNGRDQDIAARPSPPILPPIKPHEDRHRPDKRSVFSKKSIHRSNPEFDKSSMETLAVEKVCSGENDLRQIEQSKTD